MCIKVRRREETIGSQERDRHLEINVRSDRKLVEIWLNHRESEDPALRELLKLRCQKYRAQNYLVAVFQSGTEELYEGTRDLLLYNRRRQAEREVIQEQALRQTTGM